MAQTSSGSGYPANNSQPLSSLLGSLGSGYAANSGSNTGVGSALNSLTSSGSMNGTSLNALGAGK